ncbi:hypothetical protein [Xylocopilactobacillus apicola]|uniref:Uncharacterized protein n=1 Tax=Xylocopilactobacillus apicola TaxID=2932184 RepID=A0AAU9DTC7_9LACO|nr:hypothetical protein [Xylocopilactobacillus apicola]BDR59374.1 hypothetical protein XA3_18150 [Xylocopilactobacillus apicola]
MSDKKLLNNFCQELNMGSFLAYYQSLTKFVINNPEEFNDEVRSAWGLEELISIDPRKYLVDQPDLCLKMEAKRLSGKHKSIDTLAMSIRDTLWDRVTIYSGKDCPITPENELRFIKIVYENNSDRILLECSECGWTEDIQGNQYQGPIGKVFPVTIDEVENTYDNIRGSIDKRKK